ncbi:hypothetical protein [Bailinhaonella thermotolerans]|uniref:Fibronectin type-III domain-containing protein n=1 Tax=Bailinhaonella thermotolerans TaxID=1070861 RepID=A0A3A3ZZI4_9ACTN|nr:hypothetical protein [Bailinhaonella thermotolerans]RJL21119.1 hypothetical protein D5H75_38580 [Bailinhaonella thermotolerans]
MPPELIRAGSAPPFGMRLVAYAPNGARQGVLAHPTKIEAAFPLNDVSSLSFSYPAHAPGAEVLAAPCEVGLEYAVAGGAWIEPPGGRFLLIRRQADHADPAGEQRYSCPGYAWMLRKNVLYGGPSLVEGKRAFSAVPAGAIVRTITTEGQSRGALPGLSTDFTASADSAGQPWGQLLTLAVEPGTPLLTLLLNLSEQGLIDWRMSGRILQAYKPDTVMAADKASGAAVVDLRLGRDITEAPVESTLEDLASAVLVTGEAGLRLEVTNPAAATPWGRWETAQSQGGVSDTGTARLLGQTALGRVAAARTQLTRALTPYGARWLPLADYAPGDFVLAPGPDASLQRVRVRQITVSADEDGVIGGNALLGDRFLERDIKLARQAQRIIAGGTGTGGSGGQPAPEGPARVPAAPAGLVIDPQAYLDEHGYARGQITATWSAVTADVTGTALDIDGYELWSRINVAGQVWLRIAAIDGGDTTATYSPLVVGETYAFKVRATSRGTPGQFSAQVVTVIPDDATPPPVPSTPQLSTRLGVIHVAWDGLAAGGTPMPADFERLLVQMQDPLAPGWAQVGDLQTKGSLVIPGQPYHAPREIRFVAVDRSGNASAPSAAATVSTQPLVNADIIGQIIAGANIAPESITGGHILAGAVGGAHLAPASITGNKIVAGTITGGLIAALAIAADKIAANAITADKIDVGAVRASHIQSDAVTADKIAANAITTGKIAADAVTAAKIAAGTITASHVGADQITATHLAANAVQAASITAGAVTAAKIAAGAVNADKLAATITLSSRIVAGSPSGARVELSDSGLEAVNSSGQNTVTITTGGQVDIVGRITSSTSTSGKRLVVNPLIGADPEIRMYETASSYHYWTSYVTGAGMQFGSTTISSRKAVLDMSAGGFAMYSALNDQVNGGNISGTSSSARLDSTGGATVETSGAWLRLRGRFQVSDANTAVVGFALSLGAGIGWSITFGVNLAGTPAVQFTADTSTDIFGSFTRNRTNTGVEVRIASNVNAAIFANIWAYRV